MCMRDSRDHVEIVLKYESYIFLATSVSRNCSFIAIDTVRRV